MLIVTNAYEVINNQKYISLKTHWINYHWNLISYHFLPSKNMNAPSANIYLSRRHSPVAEDWLICWSRNATEKSTLMKVLMLIRWQILKVPNINRVLLPLSSFGTQYPRFWIRFLLLPFLTTWHVYPWGQSNGSSFFPTRDVVHDWTSNETGKIIYIVIRMIQTWISF